MKLLAWIIVVLALASASAEGASKPAPNDPGLVVARLYRDFAFEALEAQGYHWDGIAEQPRPVLERYFTPGFTTLILKDSQCRIRTREVCGLEAVFLFDSQDPQAYEMEITPVGREVRVSFGRHAERGEERATIRCLMVRTKAGWRIDDMVTPTGGSVRKMLAP